jgi:hypothetical protein
MAMKLYEYAVVLDERRNKDEDITDDSRIVVPVTAVLARDDAQAQLLAARSIPEDSLTNGKLDRLTVVVRPF